MKYVTCLENHSGVALANDCVTLVATVDVGPRIVEYALHGGINVLGEARDVTIETTLGPWRPYGGHRLWVAPEVNPASYAPDNEPVGVEALGERGVRLTSRADIHTSLEKALEIKLDDYGSGVLVRHVITNRGSSSVELAPWALSILSAEGEAIVPHEKYQSHAENLLPVRTLALWSYTDLSDARLTFGRRLIRVRSESSSSEPFKIGIANAQGWAAWHRDETIFIKRFAHRADAEYPDMGCNTEIYTSGDFMEVESLGPMERVEPGESVEHVERWNLFDGIEGLESDETFEAAILPLLV